MLILWLILILIKYLTFEFQEYFGFFRMLSVILIILLIYFTCSVFGVNLIVLFYSVIDFNGGFL